jgi:hypothetical protein
MRQALHLLIVDAHRGSALVAAFGSKWLLPVLTCPERRRVDRAVLEWLANRGVKGDVVGQWLGRMSEDAIDWLVVIRARPDAASQTPLIWSRLECLMPASAVASYQGWAVARSVERGRLPSMPGPFGEFNWIDEVDEWIGAAIGSKPDRLTPFRVTPHEVVLGADTVRGRVFFKGLTHERSSEARLTQVLSALAPCAFARTLALDTRDDASVWWLTDECRGGRAADPAVVALALARMQRRVMASAPVLRVLPRIDLDAAGRWASEIVDNVACAAAFAAAIERSVTAVVPESWIPMDLDPTNVLVDESGHVSFIDLDDSFLGAVPLAMAVYARRCRDRSLYAVYEQSWSPPLAGIDWSAFELAATIFDSWLGWRRATRNTERGEVHGVLEVATARLRERLRRAVHGW